MKFREFKTSSGKAVFAGRNAEQNEEVVKLAESGELVLHTEAPGSPFCVIKEKPAKKDVYETAVFCARYSRDWKKNKSDVRVHIFSGKDIFKDESMKAGTFGVKKAKLIIAKKKDIEEFG
jgi:predicted ribosome quality control (RQC) complex YloA/Tae2 family protein